MGSILSASRTSFHALIANVSSLFGIVVFLQQMWGAASLEHTLLTAASSGLAAYLILAIGYAAARGILRNAGPPAKNTDASGTPSDDAEEASETDADENTTETRTQDPESLAEAQAA